MEIKRVLPWAFLFTGLWIVLSTPASALSLREIFGLDDDDESAESQTKKKQQDESVTAPDKSKKTKKKEQADTGNKLESRIEFEEIQKMIAVLDENQRKTLLTDEKAFQNFIMQEAGKKSVLTAARANKVDQNATAVFLAERGFENVLREFYLNQLITSKIPKDFPTEELIQDYYQKNKDRFVLEERIHVWQIFLTISDDLGEKEIELVKKKAESIYTDLNKGKISFDKAAQQYSDHDVSKYKGGYLGLVKINELKEEVREPLLKLKEGQISKPIKTGDGIHIIKRGITIPRQELALDEVNDQVKMLLTTQLKQKLRQEIFKQAGKTYPVAIDDKKIEEWRLKLRTNTQTNSMTSSQ